MHTDQTPSVGAFSAGTQSPSVPESTRAESALSSSKGAVCVSFPPTQAETRSTLPDAEREAAICRASALVEFFHAEARLYEALWRAHSDFGHKAAYDLAYSNSHKARELMEALIKGRSPEFVAFLERQRGLDLPACANEGTR